MSTFTFSPRRKARLATWTDVRWDEQLRKWQARVLIGPSAAELGIIISEAPWRESRVVANADARDLLRQSLRHGVHGRVFRLKRSPGRPQYQGRLLRSDGTIAASTPLCGTRTRALAALEALNPDSGNKQERRRHQPPAAVTKVSPPRTA